MAKFGFDVSEVDVNATSGGGNYDPIPDGEYMLTALSAEEKDTKQGDGTYIRVKFEVLRGEHTGRFIWQNFNVNNANEVAQRIGRQQLVAWATACGKPDADDTDKLLERPFRAEVVIEKGKNGYKDSNRIKAFLFSDAAPAPARKAPAQPAKQAPASKSTGNPWD